MNKELIDQILRDIGLEHIEPYDPGPQEKDPGTSDLRESN